MKPVLGITLGDATGIGPEIIAKLCANGTLTKYCRPVIIGDRRVLELGKRIAKVDFPVAVVDAAGAADWNGPVPFIDRRNLDPAAIRVGEVSPESGKATGDTLIYCLELLRSGQIEGLVFAPLNKEALKKGGHQFEDEHRLFAHYLSHRGPSGEINVLNNLWTTRVTSHIPLGMVAAKLSEENVLRAITLAYNTLKQAGYARPRIAVAAVNPHGGEGGTCGREEIDVLGPAIKTAKAQGMEALGPYSSDTVFINAFRGDYDAVVTMYHDQGQIAMKLMGFQFGVTVAGGLPYPITTPAHGTAFDIAGRGVAKTEATEQALIIAARMAGWRSEGN